MQLKTKYGACHVVFLDEVIEPVQFKEIVAQMDNNDDFTDFAWTTYLRISPLYDEDLIAVARKNGFEVVNFGVETFNERLSRFIRKGINLGDLKNNLRMFHEHGIQVDINLIAGLPSQTEDECLQDMENLL